MHDNSFTHVNNSGGKAKTTTTTTAETPPFLVTIANLLH